MSDIGKIIHDRRSELGLTLEDIAKAVGVGKSTVKKWEDGFISNMKRDKISSLSKILKLNPITFIVGEKTIETIQDPNLSDTDLKILELFSSLPDDKLEQAMDYLRFLSQSDSDNK